MLYVPKTTAWGLVPRSSCADRFATIKSTSGFLRPRVLRGPGARGSDDPEGSFPSFFPALKVAIRNTQLRRSQVWFPPLRGSDEDLTWLYWEHWERWELFSGLGHSGHRGTAIWLHLRGFLRVPSTQDSPRLSISALNIPRGLGRKAAGPV